MATWPPHCSKSERRTSGRSIPGEEISDRIDRRPIHHGALNVGRTIPPPGGDSVREAMRNALAAIEAEGRRTGRPVLGHLNHPNYEWGVSTDDLAHVLEERYFEVYNGHRLVCNEGDAEHPSTEAMWDTALALRLALLDGPPLWALATDDAHSFREVPGVSNPGRGWIQVRATALEPDAIVEAMLAGDFYASSGVELREARRDSSGIDIEIQAEEILRSWVEGTPAEVAPVLKEILEETLPGAETEVRWIALRAVQRERGC